MNLPKILILDIETSLIQVYTFGIGEQHIPHTSIIKDWHILCYSAKWLGQKKLFYEETRNGNDKQLLKGLWKLLDEADILVTQNGSRFDGPRIEARMRIHRMKPYSPYKHADTYFGNKKAGFTSHKLDYLTDILNDKYKKNAHSEYPGISLWIACEHNDNKAWKVMQVYNKQDVLSTEELYINTLPW